ncbi:uncharacterized protein LOC109822893 isoform X2 [Asparagus officinalis]|uniref:uncharacterized protein LOC109822893 isoform X2 n=1 Tax=Asparagus officinalis TaxID=4686 RepID=UPI00098E5899|nr:uncharacterized protein LOC109822893 isoform X2 [Asparagus officinalis]
MDRVCSTCGDFGYAENLVTCYHCNKTSEHIYCMNVEKLQVPVPWYCEECLQYLTVAHEGAVNASKKQKNIHGDCSVSKDPPKGSTSLTRRASPVCLVKGENQTGTRKPICSEDGSHKTSNRAPISSSSQANHEIFTANKGTLDGDNHGSSSKCIMLKRRASICSNEKIQDLKRSGTGFYCDYESKTIGSQTLGLPLPIAINPDEKLLRNHAPQVCWKGKFEIFEMVLHKYEGIQCHLSCVSHCKVEKIFKDLPENLNLKELPRKDVWPRIFHLDPPTKEDIGAYFFVSDPGRLKEKYIRLLERVNSRDSALKACMKDIKLLVFSSKQLPVDSQRIGGEPYLWGVLMHAKVKRSATASTNNNCTQLKAPLESNTMNIIIQKENAKADVFASSITPPGFSAPNSGDFKCIRRAVDVTLLKMVVDPVEPEVPPGFSKITPPGFPEVQEAMRGKNYTELNVPLDRQAEKVDVKQNVLKRSIDTPPGFPVPLLRETSSVKRSSSQFSSNNMVNPINPDVPPEFSGLSRPGFPKLLSSQRSSHETKFESVMPSRNDSASCIPSTAMEGYSSKASKPEDVKPKCHQVFDNWCQSTEHAGTNNVTYSAVEKNGFNSTDSPERAAKLCSISENLPSSSTAQKVHGLSENHSSWRGGTCPTNSLETFSIFHDKSLSESGPPCSSAARRNDCAQLNVPSGRNPKEVMQIDMPWDEKIVRKDISIPRMDYMPGDEKLVRRHESIARVESLSPPSDLDIDKSEDTKVDKNVRSIPSVDMFPCSSDVSVKDDMPNPTKVDKKDRHIIKFSLKNVTNPIRQSVPLFFSKPGPPSQPKIPSSEVQISFPEVSSKNPCPSKLDSKIIFSPTGKSYAEKVSKTCQMQSKSCKDIDCDHKSAEHHRYTSASQPIEEKKGFTSFASPDGCSEPQSTSEKLPSLSLKEKSHNSSMNSNDDKQATPETRKDFLKRLRDVGGSCGNKTHSNSMSSCLESMSALKGRLLEFQKTQFGNIDVEERTKDPHQRTPDDAKGERETESKNKEDSVKKRLSSVSDNSSFSGHTDGQSSGQREPNPPAQRGTNPVKESKRSSSGERNTDKTKGEGKMQCKKTNSVSEKTLLLSANNSGSDTHKPSSSPSASQEGRSSVNSNQSESTSWSANKNKSFVSAFYGSPSVFDRRSAPAILRGRK